MRDGCAVKLQAYIKRLSAGDMPVNTHGGLLAVAEGLIHVCIYTGKRLSAGDMPVNTHGGLLAFGAPWEVLEPY